MIKKILRISLRLFLAGLVLFVLFVVAVNYNVFGHLYTEEEIKSFKNENASLILSEEGNILGKIFAENRTNIAFAEIPQHLIDALVATEDVRYFEHQGIDSQSLLRVVFKTLLMGNRSSGGGSTITQQLAKNMYGRMDFGPFTMPVNKTKEALLARRIEKIYDKNEILTLYLNTIPFGEDVFGIEAASKRFFNKKVSKLNLNEGAVLVGMLKANTFYNPRLYPDHAMERRNVVLAQMEKYDYLSAKEADEQQAKSLALDYANLKSEGVANYYITQVKNECREIVNTYNQVHGTTWDLKKDGLIIHTTINYQLQKYALIAFEDHLKAKQKILRSQYKTGSSKRTLDEMVNNVLEQKKLKKRSGNYKKMELFNWSDTKSDSISVRDSIVYHITQLHAGMLGIDPSTGAIKVWVGGVDFRHYPYDQVFAKRQMASSFKPILYAAALEEGIYPCSYLDNDEIILTDYNNWKPENYDHSTGGKYSFQASLVKSKNIPTVNLYFDVGYNSLDYLWQKLSFTEKLDRSPSISLGTASASIYEMAIAYATFANRGYLVEPKSIVSIQTPDGEYIYKDKFAPSSNRVIEESTSQYMSAMLQKVVSRGTGVALPTRYGITQPVAGKTGTSQNYSDAWFASFTPNLVLVTRVGAASPKIHFNSGSHGSGSRLALPLAGLTWKKVQNNSELRRKFFGHFPELSAEMKEDLSCLDYIEDNIIDDLLNPFIKKETTTTKKARKAERKRKKKERQKEPFLKRIFGKKKK